MNTSANNFAHPVMQQFIYIKGQKQQMIRAQTNTASIIKYGVNEDVKTNGSISAKKAYETMTISFLSLLYGFLLCWYLQFPIGMTGVPDTS